jgi:hypothetical protein
MRFRPAACLSSLLLMTAACNSFPVPLEPELKVNPYLAVYQLRGDMAMASTPGGPLNANQDLRQFGGDNYEEDIGIRADFGDGMSGLRLDYYQLDQNTSRLGQLSADFGALPAGSLVRMRAQMNEYRIGIQQEILSTRTEWRESPLDLRLGAGVVYAQRDLKISAQTDDGLIRQAIEMDCAAFYPTVRLQAVWQDLLMDVDYAISPNLDIGGDMNGVLQDFEARLSYQVPFQDLSLFCGYRYSVFAADGNNGSFGYETDLRLDGIQLGLTVTF